MKEDDKVISKITAEFIDKPRPKIAVDLWDVMEVLTSTSSPEVIDEFMTAFMWQKPIMDKFMECLAEEYSRPSYNAEITKRREEFLSKINVELLAFYASKVASAIEQAMREGERYNELYNYCKTNDVFRKANINDFYAKYKDINFDTQRIIEAEFLKVMRGGTRHEKE